MRWNWLRRKACFAIVSYMIFGDGFSRPSWAKGCPQRRKPVTEQRYFILLAQAGRSPSPYQRRPLARAVLIAVASHRCMAHCFFYDSGDVAVQAEADGIGPTAVQKGFLEEIRSIPCGRKDCSLPKMVSVSWIQALGQALGRDLVIPCDLFIRKVKVEEASIFMVIRVGISHGKKRHHPKA